MMTGTRPACRRHAPVWRRFYASAVTVQSLRLRLLLVGPLRLGLSIVWLVAARVAGASGSAALVTFAVGAFGAAFLVSNDPRANFRRASPTVQPLPAGAIVAPAWRHALYAAYPSTIGVSILAAIALAANPTLTALLGGILAGLGLAALLALREVDGGLYVEPRWRVVFRK